MRVRHRLLVIAVAAAIPLAGVPGVAGATVIGAEGCTPGYWKNHLEAWQEYAPGDTLGTVLGLPAGSTYAGVTLEQALRFQGGSGVDGARRILARAGAAAFLNAAHEGLGYPYRRFGEPGALRTTIATALTSRDRAAMLALARTLDEANNLGCPLS